jgi:hypothetical protein
MILLSCDYGLPQEISVARKLTPEVQYLYRSYEHKTELYIETLQNRYICVLYPETIYRDRY